MEKRNINTPIKVLFALGFIAFLFAGITVCSSRWISIILVLSGFVSVSNNWAFVISKNEIAALKESMSTDPDSLKEFLEIQEKETITSSEIMNWSDVENNIWWKERLKVYLDIWDEASYKYFFEWEDAIFKWLRDSATVLSAIPETEKCTHYWDNSLPDIMFDIEKQERESESRLKWLQLLNEVHEAVGWELETGRLFSAISHVLK